MDLPTDLLNIIFSYIEWHFESYKSCILVNKQLYKIIKQLCDKIPERIFISTPQLIYKLGEFTYSNTIWVESNNEIEYNDDCIIINSTSFNNICIKRNDILSKKYIIWKGVFNDSKFHLIVNKIFNKSYEQICNELRRGSILFGEYMLGYNYNIKIKN